MGFYYAVEVFRSIGFIVCIGVVGLTLLVWIICGLFKNK